MPLPYRYSVIRYEDGWVQEMPASVGILLRPACGGPACWRLAPGLVGRLRTIVTGRNVQQIVDQLRYLADRHPDGPLEMPVWRYSFRLCITGPRPVMVNDVQAAADRLYERLVGRGPATWTSDARSTFNPRPPAPSRILRAGRALPTGHARRRPRTTGSWIPA